MSGLFVDNYSNVWYCKTVTSHFYQLDQSIYILLSVVECIFKFNIVLAASVHPHFYKGQMFKFCNN